MSSFKSSCFACLVVSETRYLKIAYRDMDMEQEIFTQVKYALPELTILNPENTVYICNSCYTNLRCFSIFKKKCLENYITLNEQYIKKKQNNLNVKENKKKLLPTAEQKILKIVVKKIKNTKDESVVKQDTDAELNIKNEIDDKLLLLAEQDDLKTVLHHSIDIKEESITSEDSTDQQLEQFESDDEQDGGSSATSVDSEININSDSGSQELKCLICNAVFTEKKKFTDHGKTHINNVKGSKCQLCKKKLSSLCNLRRHLKLHFDIKEFQCRICQKYFTQKSVLKSHMKLHLNKKKVTDTESNVEFECLICDEVFFDKLEYRDHAVNHIETTKGTICPICDRKCPKNNNLQIHLCSHFGLKKFECNVCKQQYSTKTNLDLHMIKHGPKSCWICSKIFKDKNSFSNHMEEHKNNKETRPPKVAEEFKCTLCGKIFSRKFCLQQHTKSHLGIKDFFCSLCGKGFRDRFGLQMHMFVHDPKVDLKLLV